MYRFSCVVEQLTHTWPSQQALITQKVHQYIKIIQLMARNLDHTGTIFQPQHFIDERYLESESSSLTNVLSLHGDDFCFVNDLDDGDRNDNCRERAIRGDQDLILSAPADYDFSSFSRTAGSDSLQELSRYSSFFRNSTSADGQHTSTVATVDPAAISFRTVNRRPNVNEDGVAQTIPTLPTLPYRPEFEIAHVMAAPCGKHSERNETVSRKASCLRQHRFKNVSYPWLENELTETLSQMLKQIDKDRIGKIVRLYNSIGSAYSMLQLKGVLSMMRAPQTWTFKFDKTDIKTIFNSLEDVETTTYACGLKRRILLLHSIEHRDRRYQELQQDRPTSRKRTHNSPEPTWHRKVATEVLDLLAREICPRQSGEENELFESDKKKIKNHLCLARHWQRAMRCMGFGILALVPTGGHSGIQNTMYASESMSISLC